VNRNQYNGNTKVVSGETQHVAKGNRLAASAFAA
jgi:hypothetical protein